MVTEELYINGQQVDIDKDTSIIPWFQSPLFTELQSIVSNQTFNIKLPLTAKNQQIIKYVNLTNTPRSTNFGRERHPASYSRNGIHIFTDGWCQLLSIDTHINVALIWGNVEYIQPLLDSDLRELSGLITQDGVKDCIKWGGSISPHGTQVGFPAMFFDSGLNTHIVDLHRHPAVAASALIRAMERMHNITIKDNGIFNDLYIPLLSKNPSSEADRANRLETQIKVDNEAAGSGLHKAYIVPSTISQDPTEIWEKETVNYEGGGVYTRINISQFIHLRMTYRFRPGNGNDFSLQINGVKESGTDVILNIPGSIVNETATYTERRFAIPDKIYDMSDYTSFNFEIKFKPYPGDPTNPNNVSFEVTFANRLQIWYEDMPVVFGGYFPIVANLPDVSQSDLLKNLMQIKGVFANRGDLRTIEIVSVDDVYKNIFRAKDWTGKLMSNTPDSIMFTFNDFAQENVFDWDNDNDITTPTEGVLKTGLKIGKRRKELLKLTYSGTNIRRVLFSPGRTKNLAYINLYDDSAESGELNTDIKPRILKSRSLINTSQLELTFEGLDFKTILQTEYKDYAKITSSPRKIEVKCMLGNLDLQNLDLLVPVYFEQLGHHYVILSIKVRTNGVAECELLEI